MRCMAMVEGNARRLIALEEALTGVALEAVQGYLNTVPDEDLMRSLIHRQIEGLSAKERLLLRVHPQDRGAAQAAIDSLSSQWPHLSLTVDTSLTPGGVVVEYAGGLIEGSLTTYLDALRYALGA